MKNDKYLLDKRMMDETDRQYFENVFILLKNGGKDLGTIKREMKGISSELIEEWERNYSEAVTKINPEVPIQTWVASKSRSGDYNYQNRLLYKASLIDKIKTDLLGGTSLTALGQKDNDVNLAKAFSEKCRSALSLIEKHVKDIQIEHKLQEDEISFAIDTKFHHQDVKQEVIKEVKAAVAFYLENIYSRQIQLHNSFLINEPAIYSYDVATNILPISIKRIKIKSFHGIKELDLDNIQVDTKWVFITGENGFGKTVLLQAMTIGLFGYKDDDRFLVDLSTNANISVDYKLGNQSFVNHLLENKHPLRNIVCYGPSRLTTTSRFTSEDDERLISPTNSLFNPQSPLLSIENDLIIWKLDNPERFKLIKKLFKSIIPYLDDVAVSEDKKRVLYTEKQPGSKSKYEPVSFTKLASGFKSLIAMVGDMILRFYQYQPDIQDPRHFEGIVLIDELDLHMHPKLQMQLPGLLSKAFPKVQFIASTHSAIPLLGAPEQSIVIKVTRNKKDGIKAEKLDVDLKKLTPNLILTSPIFDMEKLSSVNTKDLRDVRTEDTYEEMQKNNEIDNILDDYQKSDEKYPDHLFQ